MSDEEALLSAIIANPDEDTPRLAFADWLDEHDQPERAEFIRVQIRFSLLTADEQGKGWALRFRAAELLKQNIAAWSDPISRWATPNTLVFRRGFLDELALPASVFTRYAHFLFNPSPLQKVWIEDPENHVVELARIPRPEHLRVWTTEGRPDISRWSWTKRNGVPERLAVDLLPMKPACAEPYLKCGSWLILVIRSRGSDRTLANQFLADVFATYIGTRDRERPRHFGIRPVDDVSELRAWCGGFGSEVTPLWLWLRDGKVVRDEIGPNVFDGVRTEWGRAGS